ncbi:DUF177 domain-containing protein [Hyphomicrobium sp. 1Nfss2.1]|uniref:YceD family protein n=1 Tax=Hyphomicrobium sp. 1Nfss2.1 TaxID=3413936 RepID=UPI003C79B1CE
MSEDLDWSYRVTEIPEGGLKETREATESERVRLATALEVISCRRLVAEFTIRAIGKGHYRLAGKVSTDVTQACVVTLEPIDQRATGDFDVEFWPADALPKASEDEIEALSAAEVEPIEHGRIDVGRIVFETLSASIDPYPRKDGVEFDPPPAEDDGLAGGPFAALRKLRENR